jgi:hypothetical protein
VSNDFPTGPPPSEPPVEPVAGNAETLDSRDGVRLTSSGPEPVRSRRTAVLAVAGALGVVLVGGVAWAAVSFFSTGAQPAEALPASTLGYVSIDLDPSGGQKIEALRTLKKFPALDDQLDLGTDDDLREWIFDKIQEESSECGDVDYGDDIEPWLGDRFAVAAVDTGGDTPSPIFVVQVSDDDKADAGLTKLRDCGGGSTEDGAWAINDGWALIGEDQKTVDAVAADAAKSTLSDDGDFQQWTDAAGGDGIVTLYASPEAGQLMADAMDDNLGGLTDLGDLDDPMFQTQLDRATALYENFKGGASTIRFADGGLEIEGAADLGGTGTTWTPSDDGAQVVTTLPAGTAAAFGIGMEFQDGWFDQIMDQLSAVTGESSDDLLAEVKSQTDLDLPADIETLFGTSFAISVDEAFDPQAVESSDGPEDVTGIGVKVLGDTDDIDALLDKARSAAGESAAGLFDSDAKDGAIAIAPDPDYRTALLEDRGLGSDKQFQQVVEHADDAFEVLYVDFDAVEGWLSDAGVFDDEPEAADNLEPLGALGLSAWREGDVMHGALKITTN